jgi:hypothetical protein
MQRIGKSGIVVLAAFVVVAVSSGRAHALLGVADTGDALLAQLIANGVQQLARLGETLEVARHTYDQGRRVVEYAEDGYAAAAGFRRFSASRFGEHLRRELEAAHPDAMHHRDELDAARWDSLGAAAGSASHCLGGTLRRDAGGGVRLDSMQSCADLRDELGSKRALAAVTSTFGAVPAAAAETPEGRQAAAIDAEVAAQLAAHTSQWNRAQRVKQLAAQLDADCRATSDRDGPSGVCEAASQRAQVEALAEGAETNRLLAEQSRVLALQLEQRNAELKRELADARVRRSALAEGAKALERERIAIRTAASAGLP